MFQASVVSAAVDDAAAVRAMLAAGARELALAQVDALQPAERSAPRWAEWEGLRCEALARLNRRQALLARAAALPVGDLPPAVNTCLVEAARAALVQKDFETARTHAARVLWQSTPSAADARGARLAVIESYVVERRAEDAFRSMLRFRQDYQPLDRAVLERFAEALIDLGRESDALNWVRAEEASPSRLRLQLRSGVLAPEAVIAQARAGLQKSSDPAYWRAIHDAATRSRNNALQVEALERLLDSADARDAAAQDLAAQQLWQAYQATATEVGNREQLLVGDDGAWADYAARRLGQEPYLSRAFYGYLAQRAQDPEIRRTSQLQLAHSLFTSGLDHTALRAIQRIGVPVVELDEQMRYLLGTIAAKHNDPALALKLWNGIAVPANVNAIDWHLILARTALHAGEPGVATQTMKRLLADRTTVSPQLAAAVLEMAQEMLDMRTTDAARAVYTMLVPLVSDENAREALFGLGRAHELSGEPAEAAASYLRSALFVQAAAPDTLAFQARLLAALNLMRAGLRDDARTQFEWLLKNAKEKALIEAAKRGLNRLN